MADDPDKVPRDFMQKVQDVAENLTEDDVANYIINRVQKFACPSCGATKWTIFAPADYGMSSISTAGRTRRPDDTSSAVIPVVPTFCDNCGLLQQYAAFSIAEWKLTWPPKI